MSDGQNNSEQGQESQISMWFVGKHMFSTHSNEQPYTWIPIIISIE